MADTQRRGFLKLLSGLLGAFIASVASVPVLGSVLSPLRLKKTDEGVIAACPLDQLVVGLPLRVDLNSVVVDGWARQKGSVGSVWLLKKTDGSLSAFSTVCPHSGCSILFTEKDFSCPCHDSAFNLEGTQLKGPSPRPMDSLETEVRDQTVYVRFKRFKVGVKERVEA